MPRNSYGLLTLQVRQAGSLGAKCHGGLQTLDESLLLQGSIKRDPEGNHAEFEQQVWHYQQWTWWLRPTL